MRSFALCLLVQLALAPAAVAAVEERVAPSIELAHPSGEAGTLQDGAAAQASPGEERAQTPDAPPQPEPAAAETAPAADTVAVPWWRELAGRLGLASDPRPGETAEPAPGRSAPAREYLIGSGDILGVSVWRDDTLTRTVVVLPDGKISFPLAGEVVAGGRTVAQLKRELEGKLSRYVSDVGVTVEVKQSNSMIVYIIGRVNAPGRQVMVDSTNVLQALAMAGGLNPFARRGEVKVFRREGGKTTVFPFDYDEVSEGRHLEANIELRRGDVVIVP